MGRKVFISFLGTNNYVECRYQTDGFLSQPVRFVQEALVEHLCKDWTVNDRIFIFCTTGPKGSKEVNWLNRKTDIDGTVAETIGLQQRLEDLCQRIGLKPRIVEKDIQAGFSEEEIWSIFSAVFNKLNQEDQIFFDVTHAFRSIPLFAIVLFNYAKVILGTRVESILYGAFEKLGPTAVVKDMPLDQRIAPIINLTDIARLQSYNQVASNLKEFGKVVSLSEIIRARHEDADEVLDTLSSSIEELDHYIATNDIPKIKEGEYIMTFRQSYRRAKRNTLLAEPIQRILDELYKETEDFTDVPHSRNIEAAINWTIKHDMLSKTFLLADEYLALWVAEEFKDDRHYQMRDNDYVNFIKALLGMRNQRAFDSKKWEGSLIYYPEIADKLSEDDRIIELRKYFLPIHDARNSLAHGIGRISYEELRKRVQTVVDSITYVNPDYADYSSTQSILAKYNAH